MPEWTREQLEAQGYEVDPEHPANRGKLNRTEQRIEDNDRHRDEALDKSGVARGYRGRMVETATAPLAPREVPAPVSEVDRLFPNHERARAVLAARRAAGL